MKKKVLNVQHRILMMGDVNYLFRVECKINVIENVLLKLEQCSNVLRNFLKDFECTSEEEILLLMKLIELSDMKLSCIKQLQHLVMLRSNLS
jgi:hypothetical protein